MRLAWRRPLNSEQYLIAKLAEVMNTADRSLEAKKGKGCAIRNRVQQVGDWWAVLNSLNKEEPKRSDDPKFLAILWAAEDIFYNRQADNTNGANTWFIRPISESYVKIDDLYFYFSSGQERPVSTPPTP